MMTLTRNRSGMFEGTFRAKGLRPLHLSLRTTTKREAQERHDAVQKLVRQRRADMLDQLRTGVLTVERVAAMVEHHEPLMPIAADVSGAALAGWGTVDELADRYLEMLRSLPDRSDGNHAAATFNLKPFRAFVYDGRRTGERAVDDVPRALIAAYQTACLNANLSPNTVTNRMGRVAALWRFAEHEEAKDAAEGRRSPRVLYSPIEREKLFRKFRPKERFLSTDEIERLFAATPEALLFPVYCGVGAGLRLGEVLHLRPHIDVDVTSVDQPSITIREHDGWRPKTRRSHRVVPMIDAFRDLALRHIERWASPHWMVPGVDRRKPITDEGFQRQFKAIVLRAGLPYGRANAEGVTFHTLRHSFASHAVMGGLDLYAVAKLLGDTVETVEATYARLSPDWKRNAMAKVAAVIRLPAMTGPNESEE